MAVNLIDRLTSKVDTIRQKAADRFGLPAFDMYRVYRTYSSGIIGDGAFVDVSTVIYPTPKIVFKGQDVLEHGGRFDKRTMTATEISLTYTENWLQGDPKAAGEQCFYKLVERNGQGADTTYWILDRVPEAKREEINWELNFKRFTVC